MSSTSKSKRKTNQQRQVKQPTRNLLELPKDVMANILCRVGVLDRLRNVQKVCTTWHKIYKDPAMWRVIFMDTRPLRGLDIRQVYAMLKHVVDRSQGQLIDITMALFCDDEFLLYVAERSSQLRRLNIICCRSYVYRSWPEALKKFPLLEELGLHWTNISKEAIEAVGRYCPMLKILKVNHEASRCIMNQNEIAIAIGENLHELEHLELVGNIMSNIGLQMILDGCRHLKSLDLRQCLYIDLKEGDLGKRCSQQIKCLKLPNDPPGSTIIIMNMKMRC